jgi:hypothetical protein
MSIYAFGWFAGWVGDALELVPDGPKRGMDRSNSLPAYVIGVLIVWPPARIFSLSLLLSHQLIAQAPD